MEAPEEKSAASNKAVDAITAIVIFLMGLIVIWDSWRLGARWGSDGPESGYFPFYIGLIISGTTLVSCLGYLGYSSIRSYRRRNT